MLFPAEITGGLLSPEINDQIKNQMLLSLGLGLLQGSGPSLTPTSFGQVFGQAGMNAMSQGNSLRNNAIQQALQGRRIAQEDRRLDLMSKRLETDLTTGRQPKTYEIGGAIVQEQPDGTFKPVYTAAPQLPKPPQGFQWVTNEAGENVLAAVPGGPDDPASKPLSSEATLKLTNYQNALQDAKEYAQIAIERDNQGNIIGFNDYAANLPEGRRKLHSAVASKLRADSGATVTTDDVENELKKYGYSMFSSDKTNAQAVERLLRDIKNGVNNIATGGRGTQAEESGNNDPLGIRG